RRRSCSPAPGRAWCGCRRRWYTTSHGGRKASDGEAWTLPPRRTFGESVGRGGGCVLIGVGPVVPLATFTVPLFPDLVQCRPGKSGNEKWQGAKTDFRERSRLAVSCLSDEPCECRGDWIRTSDLLNPIQAR